MRKDLVVSLTLNTTVVYSKESHSHLGMILDKKMSFANHLREKILTANERSHFFISYLNFYNVLPRQTLMNVYKYFIRPHLDYKNIISDNLYNDTFCKK